MILRKSRFVLAATIAVILSVPAVAQTEGSIAIRHGKLITVTHGTIEDGTLVMRGGRIVAVGGADTKVPAGARVIDAKGRTIYPGLFDTETNIGLVEPDSTKALAPTSEPAGTPVPWGFIADVVHPNDYVAIERYNGITQSVVSPGSQGPMPGHSVLIQLIEDKGRMVVDRDAGLVINFHGRRAVYPSTVFGIAGYARELLTRARALEGGAARRDDDAAAEAFVPYLGGKKRIIAHVRNDTEVGAALDLAQEFGLSLVLVGLTDVDTEMDRIAASGFPVVVGTLFDDPLPGRRYDYILRLPARMAAKGVRVSIGTLGAVAGGPRNLPYQAGAAVAFGLSYDQAMRSITLSPAEAFGVGDRFGSLDVGKVANVVIADGDPLNVTTGVVQVFIDGQPADMTNRQTRLRDRYLPK
ncbi:amidohydrolase family protein [Sphingopyxis panaciterrae]